MSSVLYLRDHRSQLSQRIQDWYCHQCARSFQYLPPRPSEPEATDSSSPVQGQQSPSRTDTTSPSIEETKCPTCNSAFVERSRQTTIPQLRQDMGAIVRLLARSAEDHAHHQERELQATLDESFNESKPHFKPAHSDSVRSLLKRNSKVLDKLSLSDMGGDCLICGDEFAVKATVTTMSCGHGFHDKCIARWLRQQNSCPVCRLKLDDPTSSDDVESGVTNEHGHSAAVEDASAKDDVSSKLSASHNGQDEDDDMTQGAQSPTAGEPVAPLKDSNHSTNDRVAVGGRPSSTTRAGM